jgi:hypothetical protein
VEESKMNLAENQKVLCASCGIELYDYDYSEIDGCTYCNSCVNELFFRCAKCNEFFDLDREVCHEYYGSFCDTCFDGLFMECYDCRCFEYIDQMVETNCGLVCEACYYEYHNEGCFDNIMDCEYKPLFKFYRGIGEKRNKYNRYYGIELEAINAQCLHGNDDIAGDVLDLDSIFFCKKDGSLENGFETVTHPMTFKYIMENKKKFIKLLKLLKDSGMRSYDSNQCGIHIHVSKKSVSRLTLYKLLKLFYENQDFIFKFSKRTKSEWRSFCTLDDERECNKSKKDIRYEKAKTKKWSFSRYIAINLLNDKTIEFRIFRGTLNIKSFFKNIEFCDSIIRFCEDTSLLDINVSEYKEYVYKNSEIYENLYDFFSGKKIVDLGN